MKRNQAVLAIMVFLLGFMACSKDDAPSGSKSLAGTWEGKWGSGSQDPANFFKFEFQSNGTAKRLDDQNTVIANGTWTLNGINFECTYTHGDGQVHKIGGLYTDFNGEIMGTWGWSPSKANGGTFELRKK